MREREPRVKAELPVTVEGQPAGRTRDVSATGIYFETSAEIASGQPIEFELELAVDGGHMMVRCSGEIVRVDRRGLDRMGVAVRLVESTMVRRLEAAETSLLNNDRG